MENFVIHEFAEPVTALADTPACTAAELKRRFQAPAEELRQVHNALAAAHSALDEKVEGIVAQTYGGTIHESMLDAPLAQKINSHALDSDVQHMQTVLAGKCRVCSGLYVGDGAEFRTIDTGFTPDVVILTTEFGQMESDHDYYGGIASTDAPLVYSNSNSGYSHDLIRLTERGFIVSYASGVHIIRTNYADTKYRYVAFGF